MASVFLAPIFDTGEKFTNNIGGDEFLDALAVVGPKSDRMAEFHISHIRR